MTLRALGLIEAIGLSAAITAADAAAKSANIRILGYENGKGGGRITVKLTGDVGAVRAALSAASAAGGLIGKIEATQLIARPHNEIEALIRAIDRGELQKVVLQAAATPPAEESSQDQEVSKSADPSSEYGDESGSRDEARREQTAKDDPGGSRRPKGRK